VSNGEITKTTTLEITTYDARGQFNLPPKGWLLDTDPIFITVEGRPLVAYRLWNLDLDIKWLILDEGGKGISNIDLYRKASVTAAVSFMGKDAASLRELARLERQVVAASNLIDFALFARDASSKALGAVGLAAATGGTSGITTTSAAVKFGLQMIARQMAEDALSAPEELLKDPVKMVRKTYEILVLGDALDFEEAAKILERNQGKINDYESAASFYYFWRSGMVNGPVDLTMVADTLPDTSLASQLRDVAYNVVEGATGANVDDVTFIDDIIDELENEVTIANAAKKASILEASIIELLTPREESWNDIPREIIDYSKVAKRN
jgi:hypothetical protein